MSSQRVECLPTLGEIVGTTADEIPDQWVVESFPDLDSHENLEYYTVIRSVPMSISNARATCESLRRAGYTVRALKL